jgi:hypothetical protein
MEENLRRACYFSALSRLQRGLVHDVRDRLASVALQLELGGEILAREGDSAAALKARLQPSLDRGRAALERVRSEMERALGALAAPEVRGLDLMGALREIEALVSSTARERAVTWSVAPGPNEAIELGLPDVAWEVLAIAAIESMFALPSGGRLEISAEVQRPFAAVVFMGPGQPDPAWYRIASGALESIGGSMRSDPPRLEMRLPLVGS